MDNVRKGFLVVSSNPETSFWTPKTVTSPEVRYPFRIPDFWTATVDFNTGKAMNTTSQTEIHCPNCGTDYSGAECPVCAPLERIRRAMRARRQLAAMRRQCRRTFAEKSQPPEKN